MAYIILIAYPSSYNSLFSADVHPFMHAQHDQRVHERGAHFNFLLGKRRQSHVHRGVIQPE